MSLEARFSLKGTGKEVLFTIVEGESDKLFLYSILDGVEFKFPLRNESGLLELEIENPFEESKNIIDERLVGLSSDWIETKAQGFDISSGDINIKQPGYGPDDIFVENKPFSLRQIVDLIDSQDIELAPDFQRNFIWDKTRQSKLIESILLGLPLPSIYLSQYEDGRLTVVDGLQRLSTLRSFVKDELVLTNLEYLENCNDKRFSQLGSVLTPLRIRRFSQTQIMCFVIDYRSPSKLKFDLFRRLNTGGKPLNNQEIRNCLTRPEIQYILKSMISQESFGAATDWSVKDNRMDAREAALRFIYFNEQYTIENPIGSYNGDMETTLDDFTDQLNLRDPKEIEKNIQLYDRALINGYYLFGKYCFRKITPEGLGQRRAPVNKLIMLCFSVLLSKYDTDFLKTQFEFSSLVERLADFIVAEPNLFGAITYGTNAKSNIELSFKSFKSFFDRNLNSH